MSPLVYSLQFRGFVTRIAPNVLVARAVAPGARLVTLLDEGGINGRFESDPGSEAVLESRMVVASDDAFHVGGQISVGDGHVLRYRTVGTGKLTRSTQRELRHGALALEVVYGEGQFAGASGRITSNMLLSDSGDITDTQLGVLFLAPRAELVTSKEAP